MIVNQCQKRWLAAATAVTLLGLAGCGSESGDKAGEVDLNEEAIALLPDEIKKAGVIRVGTTPQFPPFAYYKEGTQELIGYDPGIVDAIARDLDLEVEYTPMEFQGLIPALESGKIHVGAAGITDKVEREEVAIFVIDLIGTNGALIPEDRAEEITEFTDLCGLDVATVVGSAHVAIIEHQQKVCEDMGLEPMTQLQLADNPSTMLAVESGRADAAMATFPGAAYQEKQNPFFSAMVIDDGLDPRFPNGLAVTKDLPELADAFKVALEGLIESGEYNDILETNGVDPEINGVTEVHLNWTTNGFE